MKEQSLKPINNQPSNNQPSNNQLKSIQPVQQTTKKQNNKVQKYETIQSLPTWSIEPPLEIKRGN